MQAQRSEAEERAADLGCGSEDILFFSDEGISGSVLERPQLMNVLNMIKREKDIPKYFICYDSSRLSRNASHQLILIDEIKKSGAKLIFLKNNYEDNAEGRFQLTVMAAVDEYERARLKLRTGMGKRAKAIQHKLTHNPGLYGYDFDPINDKLTINEEHAKILIRIFYKLTEEHKGPSEIAEELNDSGIVSPRMKKWTRNTVRRILLNPSYMGTLYIQRYDTRECHLNRFRSKSEKVKIKEKPRNEWIPVNIPQIIERDTWERAQKAMKKVKHSSLGGPAAEYILAPLMLCGICGSRLNGKSIKRNEATYRYYVCANKYGTSKGRCASRLINADALEEKVWDYICGRIMDYFKENKDITELTNEYATQNANDIAETRNKVEKAKEEKDRVILMFQKGIIDENVMYARLLENDKKLKNLDAFITKENEYKARQIEKLNHEWKSENFPYIMKILLKKMSRTEKEHLIYLMIDEIRAAEGVVTIIERA